MSMKNKMLTISEAAEYLRVSKSTVYKMTMRREIGFYKPTGKNNYFKIKDLYEFMTRNRISSIYE